MEIQTQKALDRSRKSSNPQKIRSQLEYLEGYKRGREELLRVVLFEIEKLNAEIAVLESTLLDSLIAQRSSSSSFPLSG
jgi:hypothetical protein